MLNAKKETYLITYDELIDSCSDVVTSPSTRRYSISSSDAEVVSKTTGRSRKASADSFGSEPFTIPHDVFFSDLFDQGSPFHNDGEEEMSESSQYESPNEDIDSDEDMVKEFLEIDSSSEEEVDPVDDDPTSTIATPRRPSTANSASFTPNEHTAMLNRFASVPVTAFKQRQAMHQHQLEQSTPPQNPYGTLSGGVRSGRINKSDPTITPLKRKRRNTVDSVPAIHYNSAEKPLPFAPLDPLFGTIV